MGWECMLIFVGGVQPFNVLRYENGQHYDSHYDVFEPESYGPQASQRVRYPQITLKCVLMKL